MGPPLSRKRATRSADHAESTSQSTKKVTAANIPKDTNTRAQNLATSGVRSRFEAS